MSEFWDIFKCNCPYATCANCERVYEKPKRLNGVNQPIDKLPNLCGDCKKRLMSPPPFSTKTEAKTHG